MEENRAGSQQSDDVSDEDKEPLMPATKKALRFVALEPDGLDEIVKSSQAQRANYLTKRRPVGIYKRCMTAITSLTLTKISYLLPCLHETRLREHNRLFHNRKSNAVMSRVNTAFVSP